MRSQLIFLASTAGSGPKQTFKGAHGSLLELLNNVVTNQMNWPLKLLMFVLILGCASQSDYRKQNRTTNLDGVYLSGFEMSAFEPCNSDHVFWFELSDSITKSDYDSFWESVSKYQSRNEETGDRNAFLYLSIQAQLSPKGSYGHLGAYSRALSVYKIETIRVATLSEVSNCVTSPLFGHLGDSAGKAAERNGRQ